MFYFGALEFVTLMAVQTCTIASPCRSFGLLLLPVTPFLPVAQPVNPLSMMSIHTNRWCFLHSFTGKQLSSVPAAGRELPRGPILCRSVCPVVVSCPVSSGAFTPWLLHLYSVLILEGHLTLTHDLSSNLEFLFIYWHLGIS